MTFCLAGSVPRAANLAKEDNTCNVVQVTATFTTLFDGLPAGDPTTFQTQTLVAAAYRQPELAPNAGQAALAHAGLSTAEADDGARSGPSIGHSRRSMRARLSDRRPTKPEPATASSAVTSAGL